MTKNPFINKSQNMTQAMQESMKEQHKYLSESPSTRLKKLHIIKSLKKS